MRTTSLALLLFTAVLLTTACGKDRTVGMTATASNQQGLDVTFTPTRLDERWAIGVLHLQNTSGKPIQFPNFHIGNNYPGFRFTSQGGATVTAVDDAGYNPWTGGWRTGANPNLVELPAGVALDMTLKWRLISQPKKNTPWTITVGGMEQDGKPLAEVVVKSPQ